MTTETDKVKFHPKWMQVMYALTFIAAGIAGVSGLTNSFKSALSIPSAEPFLSGVAYSMWLTLAILSIAGLRSPLKYTPVLMFGMTYKTVWLLAVVVPNLMSGVALPQSVIFNGVSWIFVIIGYAIAIPWKHVFAK